MIGKRLKLTRDARGLSLRDLEARIDALVSAQAIGKYERDEMMPSSKVLLALARALEVTPEFLLSEREVKLECVEFRHIPAAGAREERSLDAAVLDAAERYLELESLFPDTMHAWHPPVGEEFKVSSPAEAEESAAKLRRVWKLGIDPIDSMTELLENQGVKVITLDLPHDVSGSKAFARYANGEPVVLIVVNHNDNGERQRFTLAHELGHLVLNCEDMSYKECEKASDWFAGAFLMPKEMVERVIGSSRTVITIGELEAVKRVFKVSLAAIAVRLKQLGIITKSCFGSIWGILVKSGLTRKDAREPCSVPAEVPARSRRLALRAVAEGAVSASKAAQLLRVSRREMENLLDPQVALQTA